MVNVPVMRLIGPDHLHNVPESGIRWQAPVVDGNGRSGLVLEAAVIQVIEEFGVGADGLLLQVAGDAVGDLGGGQVCEEVCIEEEALNREDQGALVPEGLGQLDKCHEVHSLVLRFFQ